MKRRDWIKLLSGAVLGGSAQELTAFNGLSPAEFKKDDWYSIGRRVFRSEGKLFVADVFYGVYPYPTSNQDLCYYYRVMLYNLGKAAGLIDPPSNVRRSVVASPCFHFKDVESREAAAKQCWYSMLFSMRSEAVTEVFPYKKENGNIVVNVKYPHSFPGEVLEGTKADLEYADKHWGRLG